MSGLFYVLAFGLSLSNPVCVAYTSQFGPAPFRGLSSPRRHVATCFGHYRPGESEEASQARLMNHLWSLHGFGLGHAMQIMNHED